MTSSHATCGTTSLRHLRFIGSEPLEDLLGRVLEVVGWQGAAISFEDPPSRRLQLALHILGFSPVADGSSQWKLGSDPEAASDDVQPAAVLSGPMAERVLSGLPGSMALSFGRPWNISRRGIVIHDDSAEGLLGREMIALRRNDRSRFVRVGTLSQADLSPWLVLPFERTRAAWRDLDGRLPRTAILGHGHLARESEATWRERIGIEDAATISESSLYRGRPEGFADLDLVALPREAFLSELDRAYVVATAASAGTLVIADDLAGLRTYLAPSLLQVIGQVDIVRAKRDALYRDRTAVAIHREYARHHAPSAGARRLAATIGASTVPPVAVSVVLATMRPWLVERSLSMIAAQTYPHLEVVIAVHGHHVDPATERGWRACTPHSVTIIEVSDRSEVGEVYTAAVAAAEGEVIVVWDDDDYYDVEHVFDLVYALAGSGADLVGKAAEFVYLADPDVTIQRHRGGRDRDSRRLGGGTFCYHRSLLAEFGGALSSTLGEDRSLIHRIEAAGGRVYRTHGYGYVLFRGHTHTWVKDSEYFFAEAVRRWDGFAGSQAGLDRRIGREGFADD